jgi:hypothetical protein
MSMHDTPRKSPRKHPSPANDQCAPKEVAKWIPEHKLQLVYILLDKANINIKSSYDKKILAEITTLLNAYIRPHKFTSVQVKNKIKRLKTNYTDFSMLLSGRLITGFGWDPVTNVVSASDVHWERLKYVYLSSQLSQFITSFNNLNYSLVSS